MEHKLQHDEIISTDKLALFRNASNADGRIYTKAASRILPNLAQDAPQDLGFSRLCPDIGLWVWGLTKIEKP